MEIHDQHIYQRACGVIRSLYGENARFRDGQYEAVEATMLHRRTLVVQRTGWGKSLVYFICTRLLREQGAGVTLVVSPLLVLMENQIEAAARIGLRCDALNSTTKDRRDEILQTIRDGKADLVLVTPETLFRDDVQQALPQMRIGLFVIDEAHCISDWGHDFRLEYSRLKEVLRRLPSNVPVLATTATANDRVVADLKTQLGDQVFVSRRGGKEKPGGGGGVQAQPDQGDRCHDQARHGVRQGRHCLRDPLPDAGEHRVLLSADRTRGQKH